MTHLQGVIVKPIVKHGQPMGKLVLSGLRQLQMHALASILQQIIVVQHMVNANFMLLEQKDSRVFARPLPHMECKESQGKLVIKESHIKNSIGRQIL